MKIRTGLTLAAILAATTATTAFAQGAGADTYKAKCVICHGADGLGTTPSGKALKAASFKDPAIVKTPNAELIATVKSGKNKMPAYAGKLTDAEITATIAYIRTLQK